MEIIFYNLRLDGEGVTKNLSIHLLPVD